MWRCHFSLELKVSERKSSLLKREKLEKPKSFSVKMAHGSLAFRELFQQGLLQEHVSDVVLFLEATPCVLNYFVCCLKVSLSKFLLQFGMCFPLSRWWLYFVWSLLISCMDCGLLMGEGHE